MRQDMRGISRYNAEGYPDPTTYAALTKILREEKKAAKAAAIRRAPYRPVKKKQEVKHGQKP